MATFVRSLLIVLVLSGLFVGLSSLRRGQLENRFTVRTTAAMLELVPELKGESQWEVSFIGRQGVVHGKIQSRELLEKTVQAIATIESGDVRGLNGILSLYNGLHFREPARFSVARIRAGLVRIEGKLSSEDCQDVRQGLASTLPAGTEIDDRLVVDREVGAIRWGAAVLEFLPIFLKEAEGCRMLIEDDRVRFGGIVHSGAEKERLGTIGVTYLGASFAYFDNQIDVISDPDSASIVVSFTSPEVISVSGKVPNAGIRDDVMARLAAVAPGRTGISGGLDIERTVAGANWYDLLSHVLPPLYPHMISTRIEVAGNQVNVEGTASSNRGIQEIHRVLQAGMGERGFEIATNLTLGEGATLRMVTTDDEEFLAAENHEEREVTVTPMTTMTTMGTMVTDRRYVSGKVPVGQPERVEDGKPSEPTTLADTLEPVVYFAINSDQIRRKERAKLSAVEAAMATNPSKFLMVSGHCDQWGKADYNLALSRKRCRAVRDALVELGVAGSRILLDEQGGSSRQEEEGPSWKKRRVEFALTSAAGIHVQ
jgi:outer membrane protein OmpA-like peptidoglycan-associated protein